MNKRMIFEVLKIKEVCKESQKNPMQSNHAKYNDSGRPNEEASEDKCEGGKPNTTMI